MDLTILYILGIVVLSVGLVALGKYLRNKNLVKAEDLIFAMKTLQLSVDIASQLNLQNENKIRDIAEIVSTSIDYVNKNMLDGQDKTVLAEEYAHVLCKDLGVQLTDERIAIIKQLIELALNNK